jgi:hypothetical protein
MSHEEEPVMKEYDPHHSPNLAPEISVSDHIQEERLKGASIRFTMMKMALHLDLLQRYLGKTAW